MMGARAHARWELSVSNTILGDRKRLVILGLLTVPIILGGIAFAEQISAALPDVLGGKKAYSPAFITTPGSLSCPSLSGWEQVSLPAVSAPAAALLLHPP